MMIFRLLNQFFFAIVMDELTKSIQEEIPMFGWRNYWKDEKFWREK